jgi:hypothetical protein
MALRGAVSSSTSSGAVPSGVEARSLVTVSALRPPGDLRAASACGRRVLCQNSLDQNGRDSWITLKFGAQPTETLAKALPMLYNSGQSWGEVGRSGIT